MFTSEMPLAVALNTTIRRVWLVIGSDGEAIPRWARGRQSSDGSRCKPERKGSRLVKPGGFAPRRLAQLSPAVTVFPFATMQQSGQGAPSRLARVGRVVELGRELPFSTKRESPRCRRGLWVAYVRKLLAVVVGSERGLRHLQTVTCPVVVDVCP